MTVTTLELLPSLKSGDIVLVKPPPNEHSWAHWYNQLEPRTNLLLQRLGEFNSATPFSQNMGKVNVEHAMVFLEHKKGNTLSYVKCLHPDHGVVWYQYETCWPCDDELPTFALLKKNPGTT